MGLETVGTKHGCTMQFFTVLLITLATVGVVQTVLQLKTSYASTSSLTVGTHNTEGHVTKPALPDVLIFRRTRKTGSSSMLEQLLKVTKRHGYVPLYESGAQLRTLVRAENAASTPMRLFVAEHNSITRADVGDRRAVIVDTVGDGYKQITSFCRYVRKVKVRDCEDGLEQCLRGNVALYENRYRWGGRDLEDEETYIDMPLSVAHPALSTKALRRVFPDVVLDVRKLNVVNSSCEESARIRNVYNELYIELDKQIEVLQKRLLLLAGYPTARENGSIATARVLDAAEALERARFLKDGVRFGSYNSEKAVSADHMVLKKSQLRWAGSEGNLRLESVRNLE